MIVTREDFDQNYRPDVRNLIVTHYNGDDYTIKGVTVLFRTEEDGSDSEPFMTTATTIALHAHIQKIQSAEEHPIPEAPDYVFPFDSTLRPEGYEELLEALTDLAERDDEEEDEDIYDERLSSRLDSFLQDFKN